LRLVGQKNYRYNQGARQTTRSGVKKGEKISMGVEDVSPIHGVVREPERANLLRKKGNSVRRKKGPASGTKDSIITGGGLSSKVVAPGPEVGRLKRSRAVPLASKLG